MISLHTTQLVCMNKYLMYIFFYVDRFQPNIIKSTYTYIEMVKIKLECIELYAYSTNSYHVIIK